MHEIIKIKKKEQPRTKVIEGGTGKIIFNGLTKDYVNIVFNENEAKS